ncbi:MAG: Gfo/Idh/MocA family oxidoreductase [Planctomycetota bacterium]|jgi:predicted dehydrogenase|nr:Gfo/Idh/MocA family oxidoreductase [Planctomycetota bacterium]
MDPVRIAIVGLRNIGKGHLRRAVACDQAVVTAVVDTDPERREQAQAEFAIPRAYADAAEAFADPAVDAVVLAVPNHLHAPLSIAALEAGKHVLVEKPMACTAAEAEAMLAARDRTGRHLLIGMNQRFSSRGYRELLASGAIGTFQYGRCRWNRRRPHVALWARGDWFCDRKRSGGGPLADIGVHKLDQLLFVLGWPRVERVSAVIGMGVGARCGQARGRNYGVEDFATVQLRLEGGGVIVCEAAYFLNQSEEEYQDMVCYGTLGGCATANPEAWTVADDESVVPLALPDVTGLSATPVEHLVAVIQGREEAMCTPEQGVDMQRILDAAYRSADQGCEVAVPQAVLA